MADQQALLGQKKSVEEVGIFRLLPPSIKYIMVTEMCERYAFYGMRAILAVFLRDFMLYSEDLATAIVHIFIFAAYLTPLLGGYIADSYWGRFKTILILALIYACGSVMMAVSAIDGFTGNPPHWWAFTVGLFLIALGTGGIKPNVTVFVGDQITNDEILTPVFGMFYFFINTGALASMATTPIIEDSLSFFWAFGVPAVLMVVAVMIFVVGAKTYYRAPFGENMVKSFFQVIWSGFTGKRTAKRNGEYNYELSMLDYAIPTHGTLLVSHVRAVLGIFVVFAPLCAFWALFDQSASRWVFQADEMDRKFWGVELPPSQIPVIGPLLLLMLIPFFDRVIYPVAKRCGRPLHPVLRMRIGLVLTTASFCIAAVVQRAIDDAEDHTVHVLYQVPQYLVLSCGEILVSITGLEFAFTQAPDAMKSVIMACWFLTVAMGNVIVVIVSGARLVDDQAMEFFSFAGFMLLFFFVFTFLTWGYVYVEDRAGHDIEASPDTPLVKVKEDGADGTTNNTGAV